MLNEKECAQLQAVIKARPTHAQRLSHSRRVEWGVGGALVGGVVVLGALSYLRAALARRRRLGASAGGLFWLGLFALLLAAIVVKNVLRTHPGEKAYRRAAESCRDEAFNRSCTAWCAAVERSPPVSASEQALIIVAPVICAFAALIVFSLYARTTLMRRARAHPASAPSERNSTFPPTAIAVLSVAIPPPARAAPKFHIRPVAPGDEEQSEPLCAICLGEMSDMPVGEIRCGHYFHHCCIEDWLRKAARPTCPLCKAIVSDDGDDDGVPVV